MAVGAPEQNLSLNFLCAIFLDVWFPWQLQSSLLLHILSMINCWFIPYFSDPSILLSNSFILTQPSTSVFCVNYRISLLASILVPPHLFFLRHHRVLPIFKSIHSTLLLKALQWLYSASTIRPLNMTRGLLWPTSQPPPLKTEGAVPFGHDPTCPWPLLMLFRICRTLLPPPSACLLSRLSRSVASPWSGASTFTKGHCGTKFL